MAYRRAALFAVAIIVFGIGAGRAARAQASYTFTRIADSSGDLDPFGFGQPALNNNGEVAFRAALTTGEQGVFRGTGGALTTIALTGGDLDFIGFRPAINAAGQVAFAADIGGFSDQGIFRGDGGALTTIARTDTNGFDFFNFQPSINDSGQVALFGETNAAAGFVAGVSVGSGGPLATPYDENGPLASFAADPALNNAGFVAFSATLDTGESGIFRGNSGPLATIADTSGAFNAFGDFPALNQIGDVAFSAFLDGGTGGIFLFRGGSLVTIADGSGAFSDFGFGTASLNNGGEVAFLADLDTGAQGLFTGADPVADRVIGAGDTLFGGTIIGLNFFRQGLNDSGQLAFTAFFDDGSTGVFLATPAADVPEPGTLALLAIPGAAFLLRRRR